MDIKMVAVDLDGTLLLEDHKTITDKTMQAIEYLGEKNVEIVIATGRMYSAIPNELLKKHIQYVITTNGSKLIDIKNNKILYSDPLSIKQYKRLVSIAKEEQIFYELYVQGKAYTPEENIINIKQYNIPEKYEKTILEQTISVEDMEKFIKDNEKYIEKFNMVYIPPDSFDKMWKKFTEIDGVNVVNSVDYNIEVNNETTNKWNAINKLCGHIGVDTSKVMTIGDSGNDLQMLKHAGIGVAMGNGYEEAKEVADYITLSNSNDGFAYAIEKFI